MLVVDFLLYFYLLLYEPARIMVCMYCLNLYDDPSQIFSQGKKQNKQQTGTVGEWVLPT